MTPTAPSIAGRIAAQLPYLRRFARALTGSRERGDAYVVAMLEAVLTDQKLFDVNMHPRVATYQTFLRVWNAMPLNHSSESVTGSVDGIADRRIETLTPMPRQVFLLAALEDFTTEDIAEMLELPGIQVQRLIDQAGREIAQQIAARVMIIEDEPLIAMDIEDLVSGLGHSVVGVARTYEEATTLAQEAKPSLVLADIQLADGTSGIDAVNTILESSSVPVIFITAYPERLLTGERPEPTFLVSKPFKPEMVKAVISQALFFDQRAGAGAGQGAAA
jgi:CheY-like chemotaxis protein